MGLFTAIAIAGAAAGAYGSYASAKANSDAAKGQAELGKYNAAVAERDALATEKMTRFEMLRQTERGEGIMGELRAKLGASGAVVDEGAPLALQVRQAFELELENSLMAARGGTEAAQLRSQAQGYRMGASYQNKYAKNTMQAGYLQAGGSLLSSFGSMKGGGMFASGAGGGGSGYATGYSATATPGAGRF